MKPEELRATAERVRETMNIQIPWEHRLYDRTDGRSPKLKFDMDCFTLAREYVSLHAAPTDERIAEIEATWRPVANPEQHEADIYELLAALRDQQRQLAESKQLNRDYEEVLADKRRLVRELDVVLFGEEGAAKQASLCDLVGPARKLREQLMEFQSLHVNVTHDPDGIGVEIPATPSSLRAYIEELQDEWGSAEQRAASFEGSFNAADRQLAELSQENATIRRQQAILRAVNGRDSGDPLANTPEGTQLAFFHNGEFILNGEVGEDDEVHCCDDMGCSTLWHVIERCNPAEMREQLAESRAEVERLRCAIWNAATQIAVSNDKRADAPASAEAHLREAAASLRMACDKPLESQYRVDVWEWLRCHDELEQEIERLLADAERYRWLRLIDESKMIALENVTAWDGPMPDSPEQFDAAIDAARKEQTNA